MSDPACSFPQIHPLLREGTEDPRKQLYIEAVHRILKIILPESTFLTALEDPDLLDDRRKAFATLMPLMHTIVCQELPGHLSCFILARSRPGAFKFFFEMMTHWLVPGNRLETVMLYAVDFQIPEFGEEVYTLCELVLRVDDQEALDELKRNLPIVETEVRMGMESAYYARRILEVKGLTADNKTAIIQEQVAYLIHRLPKLFDYDLLTEMQHILVICHDEFKAARECRHLGRIISMHYLFRKELREAVKEAPEKRHLHLKLFRATLHQEEGDKPVLGILVGINFLQDKEVLEERHLLSAIHNYLPSVDAVPHSFFSHRRGNENICTLYLEIAKKNGEEFTAGEIRLLRQELPSDVRDRIEHLMHPIFMPRNEEEVMRNIFALSNQIKYVHDLPQLIVSFDKQTYSDLVFTLILLKVNAPGNPTLQEIFKEMPSTLRFTHERSKTVGFLRKKYAKEATVFSVKLPKKHFLRRDHSIDLGKARQAIVAEVTRLIGNVRDFNGGMISKQHELLCALRSELQPIKYNELLLENFFYSLLPDIMRSVLEPKVLKILFAMLIEAIDRSFFSESNYAYSIRQEPEQVFVMIKTEDLGLKESVARGISRLEIPASKLASSYVLVYDIAYIGYLYLSDDPKQQSAFCQAIQAEFPVLYQLQAN